jgi:hypothetical protein
MTIMQNKRQVKLGFIHIPKTAGSTINQNLGKLLCPEHINIRALYKSNSPLVALNNRKGILRVQTDSELHLEIKERGWVAGHLSALAMAEFGREFTFSVFRDRKIRALSQYRFMRWRWDSLNSKSKEQIGIPPSISFSDWLARFTAPSPVSRYGHNLIVGPKFNRASLGRETDLSGDLELSDELLSERLGKIDRVYFPSGPQEVLDNLAEEGMAPPFKLEKSFKKTEVAIYKKSEPQTILELLNSKSGSFALETKIFNMAKAHFAKYWTNDEIDDSAFLSLCEKYRII